MSLDWNYTKSATMYFQKRFFYEQKNNLKKWKYGDRRIHCKNEHTGSILAFEICIFSVMYFAFYNKIRILEKNEIQASPKLSRENYLIQAFFPKKFHRHNSENRAFTTYTVYS